MKKKILALVLALVMALSLAACGNSNTPATSGSASGSGDEPTLSGDLVLYCTMTENDISALLQRGLSRHQRGSRQRLRRRAGHPSAG